MVLTGAGISQDFSIPTYRDDADNWLPKTLFQEREIVQEKHTRALLDTLMAQVVHDPRCEAQYSPSDTDAT